MTTAVREQDKIPPTEAMLKDIFNGSIAKGGIF